MIEFALLFALGFLAATLLVLLIAPVVHRRVVRFAEDRLKATMPLSPQEVRAQKDAARAGYAAETARATQKLKAERDRTVRLMLDNERLLRQSQRIAGENADLAAQMADMNVEAADLRSTCRQLESHIERLKTALSAVERDNESKSAEVKLLMRQLDSVSGEIDALRADVDRRENDIETLQKRTTALRAEREALREEARDDKTRARELEARVAREESRIHQLEDRLEKQMTANADKDTALERRMAEIDRLKTRLKEIRTPIDTAPHGAEIDLREKSGSSELSATDSGKPESATDHTSVDVAQLAETARNRAAALTLPLNGPASPIEDAKLREDIAGIAATMVALTAAREGTASPIPSLLAKAKTEKRRKVVGKSLADRVRDQLERRP